MDKIVVVGGKDLVLGFQLVGVQENYEITPEEADAQLNQLFDRADVGIIILEDAYFEGLALKTKRRLELISKPVVVQVSATGEAAKENIQALIKRAIGVSLEK
ncbi:hypothetical protein KJ765_06655 [Candidatus Micrarchaeota archaeon]|nr:hypothetical protein [Candidatus Micrarchaeota archaeon]